MDQVEAPRVAIVHEWFVEYAGSERVVEALCALYPKADLFCVFASREALAQWPFLQGRRVEQTFIGRWPRVERYYKRYLPFMPLAIEQLDLSGYDIIISSSHAVAKGVLVGPDQLHVSYVHSPIRYAWDLQHQYLRESGLDRGPTSWLARWLLHRIRIWDHRSAAGVDHFVANSAFIARRIRKAYRRDATVIHPPVDTSAFEPDAAIEREDFYLVASRLVPYKRVDLLVEAFAKLPDRRLIVIGGGEQLESLRRRATENVEFLGHQPFEVLVDHMRRARAFLFAAEEDFGIVPVEAQACGTAVIAFGRGGSAETVRDLGQPRATGALFPEQTAAAVLAAIERFEREGEGIRDEDCRANAERFAGERFAREFATFVGDAWAANCRERASTPAP